MGEGEGGGGGLLERGLNRGFTVIYENDNGEYVALNDVLTAEIRLASLVYLGCFSLQVLRAYCTFVSKEAVSITPFGPRPKKNERSQSRDLLDCLLLSAT